MENSVGKADVLMVEVHKLVMFIFISCFSVDNIDTIIMMVLVLFIIWLFMVPLWLLNLCSI